MQTINGIIVEPDKVSPDFIRCFCHDCPQARECLRYQVGSIEPVRAKIGFCVFPQTLQTGEPCPYFRTAQPVTLAWGCAPLFWDVKQRHATLLRARIFGYLGSKSTYYNYERGRYKLTPKQQQDILQIFADFGYDTAPLRFANYEEALDFSDI